MVHMMLYCNFWINSVVVNTKFTIDNFHIYTDSIFQYNKQSFMYER